MLPRDETHGQVLLVELIVADLRETEWDGGILPPLGEI
jgi:hypothetical protein